MININNNIKLIGFDADDTLWINEPHYRETEQKFSLIMSKYIPAEQVSSLLFKTESKNMELLGYGAKAFTISLIETAIQISNNKITSAEIIKILNLGKKLIDMPIKILDGVENVLSFFQNKYELIMITKGDLLDQERKLAKSGLKKYFHHIEIVSNKNKNTYSNIINKLGFLPQEFMMIGNSLKSDVLPVIEIGSKGVYIPYHTTWEHEIINEDNITEKKYPKLNSITDLFNIFIV